MLSVEPIRSKACLADFQSGIREIDVFARQAFVYELGHGGRSQTYCLYDESAQGLNAVGFYTLSTSFWTQMDERFRIPSAHVLINEFVYIEYFALIRDYQRNGIATWLMADVFLRALQIMASEPAIQYLALNAYNELAVNYFSIFWKFRQVTATAHPLMVVERSVIGSMLEFIAETNSQKAF